MDINRKSKEMLIFLAVMSLSCTSKSLYSNAANTRNQRVVFQTIALSGGVIVKCYGRCQATAKADGSHFNVTRCEGSKIRFGCEKGYGIITHTSVMGRISPELETCNQNTKLSCAKDITYSIQKRCNKNNVCAFDVDDRDVRDTCGKVAYLSLDITYSCELLPSTTTTKATSTRMKTKSPILTDMSPSPVLITKSIFTTPITTTTTTKPTIPLPARSQKESSLFWLMTAYTFLTESRFIKENRTHLALTLLLAIFVGLIVSLCFLLDHCRRTRLKKDKQRQQQRMMENGQSGSFPDEEDGRGIHLVDIPREELPIMNGNVPKEKEMYFLEGNGSKEHIDEEDNEDETQFLLGNIRHDMPSRLFNRNSDDSIIAINTHFEDVNYNNNTLETTISAPPSPGALPPPPQDFLENLTTVSNELLPPPSQFQEHEENLPSLVVTSPTPTNSSLTSVRTKRRASNENHGSENKSMQRTITYPKTIQAPRRDLSRNNSLKETNKYLISPNVRFALHRRSVSAETLHKIATSHIDVDAFKTAKTNLKKQILVSDSPQTGNRNEQNRPRQNNKTIRKSTNECPRHQRKARQPAIKSFSGDEDQRFLSNREAQGGSVLTVPKHPCGSKHNHPCICIPSRTPTGGYMCSCAVKYSQGMKTCCLNEACSYRAATNYSKEGLSNHINQKISYVERNVEESGYHSHDTDCSSTRSTDQEDSLVFSPNVNANMIPFKPKHIRRSRRTDHGPSESSMEDDCSRDSIKIVRKSKHRKKDIMENKILEGSDMFTSTPRLKEQHKREGILKNVSVNYNY